MIFAFVCRSGKTRGGDISHVESFQTVELGQSVTITCRISNAERNRVWYKLSTESRLQAVASTDTLYNLTTYKIASHRYTVRSEHLTSHLTITSSTWKDAGTYYCGVMNLFDVEFGSGTFLIIKGTVCVCCAYSSQLLGFEDKY